MSEAETNSEVKLESKEEQLLDMKEGTEESEAEQLLDMKDGTEESEAEQLLDIKHEPEESEADGEEYNSLTIL